MEHTLKVRAILGVRITPFRRNDAIDFLTNRLSTAVPTRLAFANSNLLNMAYEDAGLRHLLNGFVVLNDGVGANLASKLLYKAPFPENLNGTDFCPAFLDGCERPLRLYLLGGRPQTALRAAVAIGSRWPRHKVVGCDHGFFQPSEFAGIRRHIAARRPDLVFVAMGNGRQEQIVNELVPSCAPAAWGVGAWFDFLVGEFPRAPYMLQRVGAEWIYRFALEPGRLWRRYVIGNPIFLWRVFLQWAKGRS